MVTGMHLTFSPNRTLTLNRNCFFKTLTVDNVSGGLQCRRNQQMRGTCEWEQWRIRCGCCCTDGCGYEDTVLYCAILRSLIRVCRRFRRAGRHHPRWKWQVPLKRRYNWILSVWPVTKHGSAGWRSRGEFLPCGPCYLQCDEMCFCAFLCAGRNSVTESYSWGVRSCCVETGVVQLCTVSLQQHTDRLSDC
jgi:hypothetical protein